jgi:hypothetical protein
MGESIQEQQKRHPQAWEIAGGLTEPQIWQAFAWAQSLGYRKAAALIAKEFNVPQPSTAAMCKFYEHYLADFRAARIHKVAADAAAIRALAQGSEKNGPLNDALASTLEQEASAAILAGDDPERMRLLVGLALKSRMSVVTAHAFDLEVQKYKDATKSAIERGMEALADEIKDSPLAMSLYEKFRDAVRSGLATAEKVA